MASDKPISGSAPPQAEMTNKLGANHRGFEPEDIQSLKEAHDWIAGLADRSCDCYMFDEQTRLDNPCDVCQARRAADALGKVIDPRPITLHPERLKNQAERIFYEAWCKENERKAFLNSGFTLIEWLLCPEGQKKPQSVSQHDMTIATTVIQWLGTNCGLSFMRAAEGEIEKRQAARETFHAIGCTASVEAWREISEKGDVYKAADAIAGNFISREKNSSGFNALRTAIVNVVLEQQKVDRQKIIAVIGQHGPVE